MSDTEIRPSRLSAFGFASLFAFVAVGAANFAVWGVVDVAGDEPRWLVAAPSILIGGPVAFALVRMSWRHWTGSVVFTPDELHARSPWRTWRVERSEIEDFASVTAGGSAARALGVLTTSGAVHTIRLPGGLASPKETDRLVHLAKRWLAGEDSAHRWGDRRR